MCYYRGIKVLKYISEFSSVSPQAKINLFSCWVLQILNQLFINISQRNLFLCKNRPANRLIFLTFTVQDFKFSGFLNRKPIPPIWLDSFWFDAIFELVLHTCICMSYQDILCLGFILTVIWYFLFRYKCYIE